MSDAPAKRTIRPTTKALVVLLAVAWVLRLATIGAYPLMDSTEGRYADIPREMVRSGEWIMPPLDPGVPFWGKPPMSFWVSGAAYVVAGVNQWTARLQGFLFTLATAFAVWGLGRVIGGRDDGARLGLLAAAVYSSMVMTFAGAASTLADPALGCFLTVALLGLVWHVREAPTWRDRNLARRRLPGWTVGAAIGLAILSKGLLAIVLFGIAGVLWLVLSREWRTVLRFPWFSATLICAAVAVPWHLAAEAVSPGFLDYYIVGEHYRRYVDTGWAGDLYGNPPEAPYGAIWIFALGAALPWPLLLFHKRITRVREAWRAVRADPTLLLCLCWALAPLLLFSASMNSSEHYVIPVMPPIALLIGRWLMTATNDRAAPRDRAPGWLVWILLTFVPLLGAIASVFALPHLAAERTQRGPALWFNEYAAGDPSAELIYFDELPQSADFYTDGAARVLPAVSHEFVAPLLDDDILHVFVLDEDEVKLLRRIRSFREFNFGGLFGDYTVFAERTDQ